MAMSRKAMKDLEKKVKKINIKIKDAMRNGDAVRLGMHIDNKGRIFSMIEKSLISRK